MPEHAVVQKPNRCEDPDRRLLASVQRDTSALESGNLTPAEFKQRLTNPETALS